jgi:hypothetical protein
MNDYALVANVRAGYRPARPTADECAGEELPDALWNLIESCWKHDPEARPAMNDVVVWLESVINGANDTTQHRLEPTPCSPMMVDEVNLEARPSSSLDDVFEVPALFCEPNPDSSSPPEEQRRHSRHSAQHVHVQTTVPPTIAPVKRYI